MQIFKFNSWKDILVHLGIILLLCIGLLLYFFKIYLPNNTNHGETITVPNVRGIALEDLDEHLKSRNLRFEVTEDSGFSAEKPPLTVLKQFPLPNSKVKENRMIYVTLNAENPPLVRIPNLVDGSVKNALLILKTYDLVLGDIEYVPDLALNSIHKLKMNGREVLAGERIPKGSVIDLVVGDGLGNQSLNSPNLIGLDLESAEIAIVGSGLKIGRITHEKEGIAVIPVVNNKGDSVFTRRQVPPGSVFKQQPKTGKNMQLGEMVDLWVYSPDSLNVESSILEE